MRIGIIGGGASGMVAAITAAKEGAEVMVLEKNDRVGKKILATGNGKCNLGNLEFHTDHYYCSDPEKLHKIFRVFSPWDTITFFEDAGLMIKEKNGYLYPYSEQASAVLDILRMQLERTGVKVMTEVRIREAIYDKKKECFTLRIQGETLDFDRLILACGSPASLKNGEGLDGYRLAEAFGHQVTPLLPGLCGLRSDENFVRALAGVRAQAKVELWIEEQMAAQEIGEVQFTDYGISGIPVFQMSRLAADALKKGKTVQAVVDFFPDREEDAYQFMNRLRFEAQKEKTLENYMTGVLNKKINMVMIKQAGCKASQTAKEAGFKKVEEIMQLCRRFTIHISKTQFMENAQICAGGVRLEEITTELESVLVKGLYFAGEMVDVDGKCGGYNLQWAWSSGYTAGKNAAGNSTEEIANAAERAEEC